MTLLSKAWVSGLAPVDQALHRGQRGGVGTPESRGCPRGPVLVFSLSQLGSASSLLPVAPFAGSLIRAGVLLPPGLTTSLPC